MMTLCTAYVMHFLYLEDVHILCNTIELASVAVNQSASA